MNSKLIAIAAALYFAIFLLAHRPSQSAPAPMFTGVHDLSSKVNAKTLLTAPEGETVGRITPDRFVVPLVVLDGFPAHHSIDLNDIAAFEQKHGTIAAGALIAVQPDATIADGTVSFLSTARRAYGLAAEQNRNADALRTARHLGLYTVANLNDLAPLPATGTIVVIAPNVGENGTTAPARIYSLLR